MVQLKSCMAGACVFGIIISKFGNWKESGLIVLIKIDKNLKKNFYSIVLPFSLAVSLQIKGVEKPMLDAEEVREQWPEFRDKKRASIGNNWVYKTVVTHYHIY